MKLFKRTVTAVCAAILAFGAHAANYAWPTNYEGVMLQGFYWDSYTDTKWTKLESQADELSKYFKLIWIPNSGYCGGHNNMGYMPIYWFTNHNSSFGTEKELRSMIATFKAKGTGFIADVVVNHRNGATNWTDFPAETWNGTTWKIGPEGICSTDEVRYEAGQAKPTGAADTGDDFNGARDLDHTNANVQNNVKNYCKFLLEDLGYVGFRYDMVKGYSGYYNKIYNEYSKPTYSVGEYWDGQYDAVKGWIDATGKQSAAFDFPCKYAINEAFASNDMTKLVWYANGTNPQPAGMIHFGYAQYAVTFVDNHDTYRDGSKFTGNVPAANAFIICSPGTPCVFLPHWQAYKAEIKALIDARNSVGVHNLSPVKVLKTNTSCYMAEVTGTKGKLVVKVGSSMDSPSGYSNSDIVASGNNYCVWTTANGGSGGGGSIDIPVGEEFTVYFDNSAKRWTTPHIHYWGGTESSWPGVAMTKVDGNVWSYTVPAGTTGCLFNAGDGDATKTGDMTASANHIYDANGDKGEYVSGGGGDTPVGDYPAKLYLVGTVNSRVWDVSAPIGQTSAKDGVYVWDGVKIDDAKDGTGLGFFTIISKSGANWDVVNGADRYGAATKDEKLEVNKPATLIKFPVNVSASSANSWCTTPGEYTVVADLKNMNVTLKTATGISGIEADEDVTPVYYTPQGVRVDNPSGGLYIVKRGGKVTKEYIR